MSSTTELQRVPALTCHDGVKMAGPSATYATQIQVKPRATYPTLFVRVLKFRSDSKSRLGHFLHIDILTVDSSGLDCRIEFLSCDSYFLGINMSWFERVAEEAVQFENLETLTLDVCNKLAECMLSTKHRPYRITLGAQWLRILLLQICPDHSLSEILQMQQENPLAKLVLRNQK